MYIKRIFELSQDSTCELFQFLPRNLFVTFELPNSRCSLSVSPAYLPAFMVIKKHFIKVGCLVHTGKLLNDVCIGGCTEAMDHAKEQAKRFKTNLFKFSTIDLTPHIVGFHLYIMQQYLGLLRNTQRQTAVQQEFPSCLGWKKHNMD